MRSALLLAALAFAAPAVARRHHRAHRRPVAAAPAPQPMALWVSPAKRAWGLADRRGGKTTSLVESAAVRAIRADGTDVEWTACTAAPDGHSFTLVADDLKLVVVAQWLDPARLPTTAVLMPVAYARKTDVALRELRLADGARITGLKDISTALESGFLGGDKATVRTVAPGEMVTSWCATAALGSPRSICAGYLSNVFGANAVQIGRGQTGGVMMAASSQFGRLAIPPTASGMPLDPLYVSFGDSPNTLLKQYAAGTRVFTNVLDPAPAYSAWPSPLVERRSGGEDGVLQGLDGTSGDGVPKPIRVIEVDAGYQKAAGDWDANESFPHGHRWLTDRIHAKGFKAGLRLAPFVVARDSSLYRDHPDWCLKTADGSARVVPGNGVWGQEAYCLNPGLPAVRSWLWGLCRTVVKVWGYDFVELDMLGVPASSAGEQAVVRDYRAAVKAMRAGAGPKAYLSGVDAPLGPSVGLLNGNAVVSRAVTDAAGLQNVMRNAAARQWMHTAWWQNRLGDLSLGPAVGAPIAGAWSAVTTLAVRSPTGWRNADLWSKRVSADEAPAVWARPAGASPAQIAVAVVFNWSGSPRTQPMNYADLAGLPANRRVHIWDVWSARYLGASPGVASAPPEGVCTALTIVPDAGHPQLLGTDADLTAGNTDLLGVSWLPAYSALKGRFRATAGRAFRVAVTEPPGYTLRTVECPNGLVEQLPSESGSAVFRLTPRAAEVAWVARYAKL